MLVALLMSMSLAAEPPPVPDPFGLGERLALVDVLRDTYHLTPEPGTSVDELRRQYADAWRAAHPDPVADDAARVRDEAERLRRRLRDRYRIDAPATASLDDLRALWRQHEDERQAADAAHIAERLQQEPPPTAAAPVRPAPVAPAAHAARPAPSDPDPASCETLPTGATMAVRDVAFHAPGVAACRLFTGAKTLLAVQFGPERAREFHGVFEYLAAQLQAGQGPSSAVVLLGHGSGVSIAGEPIAAHLRHWKDFYETLGGSRTSAPVDCLVIASCSRGSPVQMAEMRDGLGYYPVWRVATADRTYANAPSVLAAFTGAVAASADAEFRGLYRWGTGEDAPASVAEVGRDGARGNMRYFTVTVADRRLVSTER